MKHEVIDESLDGTRSKQSSDHSKLMHFTEINSDYLLLDSHNFSLRIMAQYQKDYTPWYEAAVKFNLTSLAESKLFFNEDF